MTASKKYFAVKNAAGATLAEIPAAAAANAAQAAQLYAAERGKFMSEGGAVAAWLIPGLQEFFLIEERG